MARAGKINFAFRIIGIEIMGFMALIIGVLFAPSAVWADVDLFVAPQFGISILIADTDGVAVGGSAAGFSGDDSDAAPLLGLAIGVEVPMNEMVPREWLTEVRLPDWKLRFELEETGLRDYDFQTKGGGAGAAVLTTEIQASTLLANAWTDIPLNTIWRPAQYVFGLGRQPRLRQILEPGSFYIGGGIGFAMLEMDGTDNVFSGDDVIYDFAWNVGAGFNYEVNDRFTLSAGYRYVGLGPNTGFQELDLDGPTGTQSPLEYDMQVHEFRFAVKIRIISFRGAWR